MRSILLILLSSYVVFVSCQTISNIRLVDHTSYIIELIQKTLDRVQKNNWRELKVQDVRMEIDEDVLNTTVKGTIDFTNGFIVSMQRLDLVQSSVQQVWIYNRLTNITNLELRSMLRMHDVAIGFDVDADLNNGKYRKTGVIVYPLIQFDCRLIKNVYTDELSSTVTPVLPLTRNTMNFLPQDDVTQVLSVLFHWNNTFSSVETWANTLAPIILDLAKTEHKIPDYCYNCPA
ncbi:unnamed protein product [Colias eurytheme]|nr:unnamed protein product [Colias eurytheme]